MYGALVVGWMQLSFNASIRSHVLSQIVSFRMMSKQVQFNLTSIMTLESVPDLNWKSTMCVIDIIAS